MIRINCAIWSFLCLIGLLLINKKKVQSNTYLDLDSASTVDNESAERINRSDGSNTGNVIECKTIEPTFIESMKDYRTYYIWAMMILSLCYPFFIAINFKNFGLKDIPDDRFITLVGSLGAVMNGLSRGGWGTLQNFYGFKIVYFSILVIQIFISMTLVLVHQVKFFYLVWVVLTFSTLGGHFSIFPTL
mmetsp:Transcript_1877/g.1675  ORF Transcript_1877/g.1675 Transcript_1877/m.1675 type:complete len:189 (-) Transcript_1877:324-890(-)